MKNEVEGGQGWGGIRGCVGGGGGGGMEAQCRKTAGVWTMLALNLNLSATTSSTCSWETG